MQVVGPGSESQSMIEGISEEHFQHIKELPLKRAKQHTALIYIRLDSKLRDEYVENNGFLKRNKHAKYGVWEEEAAALQLRIPHPSHTILA